MKKRILCALLSMLLLMTLLPVSALAANNDTVSTTIKIGADGLPEDKTTNGYWNYSESVHYEEYNQLIIDKVEIELVFGEFYLTGETLYNSTSTAVIHEFSLYIKPDAKFISGSTACDITNSGTISGGNHGDNVTNTGLISGGTFTGEAVDNRGAITGGLFKYGIFTNPGNAVSCRLNGVGDGNLWLRENTSSTEKVNSEKIALIPGVSYNIYCDKKPAGLYIVTEDDSVPSVPYKIQTGITPILGGFGGYSFVCPDKDFTVCAYFFDEPLTIDGGIGDNTFVFYKGAQAPGYTFSVNPVPENITAFTWSAEGLPDGLKLTESTPDSSVTISGTPTKLTDVSDVKIKASATDTAGKSYYGELTIKAAVEEPYADVKTLVENAECTVPMKTANAEAEVLDWLNNTWLPGLLEGKRLSENDVYTIRAKTDIESPFTAAVGGTKANPQGTDGSLLFEIGMKLEAHEGTSFEPLTSGTATVKATAYSHTHSMTHYPRVEPTHIAAGSVEYWYCEGCQTYFSDTNGTQEISQSDITISVIPHSFGTDWVSDANGHWHECACGEKNDSAAHTPGVAATETQPQKCTVCGYIITPATGHIRHTLTLVPAVDASCTAAGNTAYYTCSGCDNWFSDADGTQVISDKNSVIISKIPHTPGNEWSEDKNGHWHVCTVCKAKCSEGTHQYDGISDHICSVCGYSSSLTIKVPDFTFDEDLDKSVGIRFSPEDSAAVPAGASLSVQTYTPTAEDISAAVTEGFSQKADISEIKKYTVRKNYISISNSFTHQSKEYYIGDMVYYKSTEYIVCSISTDHKYMYCCNYQNGKTLQLNSQYIIADILPRNIKKLENSYMTLINSILYEVKFEETVDNYNTRNTLLYIYTTDGIPAGKVTVQKNSKGEDFIALAEFNTGYDPESLSDKSGKTPSPDGSFTANGKDYLVYTVFSQDISVNAQNGEKLNVPGNMEFTGFPTVKDAVSYIVMHSGEGLTKNQIEKTTYTVNSDCSISLNTDHQSPFMIFAIVENTVAETPVKTIEDTGDTETPQTDKIIYILIGCTLLLLACGGVTVFVVIMNRRKKKKT